METSSKSDKYDFMIKLIIIGDSGVGKTNLITRFCEDRFKDSYVATIGVDFKVKTITIDQKKYRMQIWDTAGQQRFKNITQTYYRGAAGIILTYSIIDRQSFLNIEKWMTQIQSNAPNNVEKILLATKNDLADERNISTEEGKALAQKFGIPFIEVSAKTSHNVNESFEILVKKIHQKLVLNGDLEGLITNRKIMIGNKHLAERQKKQCNC